MSSNQAKRKAFMLFTTLTLMVILSGSVFVASASLNNPKIYASDASGITQTSYQATSSVFAHITATGSGSEKVRVYVLASAPYEGQTLTDIRGTYTKLTVTSTSQVSLIWAAPLTVHDKYYLVLDWNADGKYSTSSKDCISSSFAVASAELDHFIFNSVSSPQTAGSAFSITLTAKDQYNNTVTSYSGSNSLSVSTGTIEPTVTGSFASGTKTLNVKLTGASSGVIISTNGAGKSGSSNSFTVTSGSLDYFTMAGYPSSVAPSERFDGVLVTAYDAYGNIKTDYTGKVYFTSTDPKATLPYTSDNPYTFLKTDNGAHQFDDFAFKTSGEQILIVTEGTVSTKSEPIKVDSISIATTLTINCSPSTVNTSGVMETTVNGRLTLASDEITGIPSKTITLSYFDGVTWNTIATVTTGLTGSYSFDWAVPSTLPNGFYMIKATFSGDSLYEPSEAVTNGSGGLFVLPEYTFGALVALFACFGAFILFKKRSSLPLPKIRSNQI